LLDVEPGRPLSGNRPPDGRQRCRGRASPDRDGVGRLGGLHARFASTRARRRDGGQRGARAGLHPAGRRKSAHGSDAPPSLFRRNRRRGAPTHCSDPPRRDPRYARARHRLGYEGGGTGEDRPLRGSPLQLFTCGHAAHRAFEHPAAAAAIECRMTPARPKLLFWVQHLLGIGHLRRAATLARALCSAGFDVKVVSGGLPVPGLDVGTAAFVQLPPTRAVDVYFKVLVDETGKEIDDAWRENRKNRLLEVYDDFRPDILLMELFPFGRRQLRSELVPLLEFARGRERRPLIACSVRDILVAPAKDERMREMLERARRYYDLVLIHGDPDLVSFDETFPHM